MQEKRREIHNQQLKDKTTTVLPRGKAMRTRVIGPPRDKAARDSTSGNSTPQHRQRQASYNKATIATLTPVLRPCALVGPDGQTRDGWEMLVGEMVFGKADAKETLLAYYSRLHEPLPSGHWKERTWQPIKKRVGEQNTQAESDVPLEDADLEFEPSMNVE